MYEKRALYITYDGIRDPLGQSQILPYLKCLPLEGVCIWLISFEKGLTFPLDEKAQALMKELIRCGIKWIPLKFHNGGAIFKFYDMAVALFYAFLTAKRNNIKVVHSRGHFLAFIGVILKFMLRTKFIFDMRGVWVEEKVDAGAFKKNGFIYYFMKYIEKALITYADEIVVLTKALQQNLQEQAYWKKNKKGPINIIPTCVNLDLFSVAPRHKDKNTLSGSFVLSYSGSIGTYYNLEAVVSFYNVCKNIFKGAHLLIISNAPLIRLEPIMRGFNLERPDYTVKSVDYSEVPYWLGMSDAGAIFYNRTYSALGCCPTKFAEYLACGLPVIVNKGIGDIDSIVQKYRIGAVIPEFSSKAYFLAASTIRELLEERDALRERCRMVAETLFSLQGGVKSYSSIYERLKCKQGQ